MSIWAKFIHIGDLGVMIPTGLAIAAYLILTGEWRMAGLWFFLLSICIGLVAGSKIAHLGWGYGVSVLNYNALSGHAASSAVITPVCLLFLSQSRSSAVQKYAVLGGYAAAAILGILLVLFNEHTVSEVIGGFLIGACSSLFFIWRFNAASSAKVQPWLLPISLMFFLSIWYWLRPPINTWMVQAAMHVSVIGTIEGLPYTVAEELNTRW